MCLILSIVEVFQYSIFSRVTGATLLYMRNNENTSCRQRGPCTSTHTHTHTHTHAHAHAHAHVHTHTHPHLHTLDEQRSKTKAKTYNGCSDSVEPSHTHSHTQNNTRCYRHDEKCMFSLSLTDTHALRHPVHTHTQMYKHIHTQTDKHIYLFILWHTRMPASVCVGMRRSHNDKSQRIQQANNPRFRTFTRSHTHTRTHLIKIECPLLLFITLTYTPVYPPCTHT